MLFSNTLNLCCYLSLWDQVWHPYKTTGKTIVLYTLIFAFMYSTLEEKYSAPNDSKHYPTSICYSFLKKCRFDLLGLLPNIWTVTPCQRIMYLYVKMFLAFYSRDMTIHLVLSEFTSLKNVCIWCMYSTRIDILCNVIARKRSFCGPDKALFYAYAYVLYTQYMNNRTLYTYIKSCRYMQPHCKSLQPLFTFWVRTCCRDFSSSQEQGDQAAELGSSRRPTINSVL
jgi:hypothetical protein